MSWCDWVQGIPHHLLHKIVLFRPGVWVVWGCIRRQYSSKVRKGNVLESANLSLLTAEICLQAAGTRPIELASGLSLQS